MERAKEEKEVSSRLMLRTEIANKRWIIVSVRGSARIRVKKYGNW